MEHHPEVLGDCCLNGEPSSPYSIRFGEKGPLWLRFTLRTAGAHGAYTHASPSATRLAARLIHDLEKLEELEFDLPDNLARAQAEAIAAADKAMGPGAGEILPKVTLNIGTIQGGLKVNMIPGECSFEADFRLPIGMSREHLLAEVEKVLAAYPEATVEEINCNLPSYCDPCGDMVEIIQNNVEAMKGFRPKPVVSLGGTDARLWRYANVPAYVYGVFPKGMGSADEHCDVEEFLHVVRTHVLSAYDYLMAS
jgi:succinyl-diaminopimelate desuccinylase